jgi:ABC-type multidrug transport system fused ATPase/permease subunit
VTAPPGTKGSVSRFFRLDIYRRLLRYVRPYKLMMAGVVGFSVLQSLLGLIGPWPFKFLIDSGLGHHRLPGFIRSLFPFLVGHRVAIVVFSLLVGTLLWLVGGAMSTVSDYMKNRVNRGLVVDYRTDLFSHLQRLSFSYHDRHPVGDSMYRVNSDTWFLSTLVWGNFRHVLTSVITFVGMLVILLELDWVLALVALAFVPIVYTAIAITTRRFMVRSRRIKEADSAASSIVQEVLTSLKVVKAFGQEEREDRRFADQSQTTLRETIALSLREDVFGMGLGLVTNLNRGVVTLIAAIQVIQGHLTIGELLVVQSYVSQLQGPVSTIGETLTDMQMSLVSALRTIEVLDEEPDVKERPGALAPASVSGAVAVENVSFAYPDGPLVLRDVSLAAMPGEVVALVGPTGAGKTTLANLLCRFYDPAAGRVTLDGIDLRDLSLRTLRDSVALVLQEPVLFAGTVATNVAYGRPDAPLEDVVRAAQAAGAHDFIMALPDGYDTDIGQRGSRLSGGERQRLSVARAFLKDAPVLILDEPTSSVDSRTELLILDALDRLMAGRTTFIIAHRLSTVRRADQIVVVSDGAVAERGSHDELLEREGLYAELYSIQSAGLRRERDQEGVA